MSGKYNSQNHRLWSRHKKLVKEFHGLELRSWLMKWNGSIYPVYDSCPYTGYFAFHIDEDDESVCAMKIDHDENMIDEDCIHTIFQYEGNDPSEWCNKENFEKHQVQWVEIKEFVKNYNKFYDVKGENNA